MDMLVPLTLEATRLVLQIYPGKFNSTPEHLYDLFYKKLRYTHIYIYSDGAYSFINEPELKDRQYVRVTMEEIREMLFIHSLEN